MHHTVIGPPMTSALLGMRLTDQAVLWSRPLDKMSFDTPLVLPDGRVVLGTWSDTQAVKASAAWASRNARPGVGAALPT